MFSGRKITTTAAAICIALSAAFSTPASAAPTDRPLNYESTSNAWMDEVGSTFLANQDKLADYVTWIQKDDRYYDAGYVGAVADVDHLQLTLLWKGVSPLQSEALTEGARRNVKALLEARPYSLNDRAHFQDLLEKSDDVLREIGLVATGLDGITAENIPLTVQGHVASNALAAFGLDTANQLVSRITGVPTKVRLEDAAEIPLGETTSQVDAVTGARLTGSATRDTDTVQFNSGGLMARGGLRCTNGFTISTTASTTQRRHGTATATIGTHTPHRRTTEIL